MYHCIVIMLLNADFKTEFWDIRVKEHNNFVELFCQGSLNSNLSNQLTKIWLYKLKHHAVSVRRWVG